LLKTMNWNNLSFKIYDFHWDSFSFSTHGLRKGHYVSFINSFLHSPIHYFIKFLSNVYSAPWIILVNWDTVSKGDINVFLMDLTLSWKRK
jgi:hypothetical protein